MWEDLEIGEVEEETLDRESEESSRVDQDTIAFEIENI